MAVEKMRPPLSTVGSGSQEPRSSSGDWRCFSGYIFLIFWFHARQYLPPIWCIASVP